MTVGAEPEFTHPVTAHVIGDAKKQSGARTNTSKRKSSNSGLEHAWIRISWLTIVPQGTLANLTASCHLDRQKRGASPMPPTPVSPQISCAVSDRHEGGPQTTYSRAASLPPPSSLILAPNPAPASRVGRAKIPTKKEKQYRPPPPAIPSPFLPPAFCVPSCTDVRSHSHNSRCMNERHNPPFPVARPPPTPPRPKSSRVFPPQATATNRIEPREPP